MCEKDLQKISVIIPTYNRAHCITKSIESVLNQTYPVYEVIIADDCSKDNTEDIIRGINDPRVKYYRLPQNKGAGGARNYGVSKAESSLIAFHDSDDVWLPDKLEKQMTYWDANPDFGLIYTAYLLHAAYNTMRIVPQMDNPSILEGNIFSSLLVRNTIGAPTVLLSKKVFEEVQGFDETMRSLEDWDFALKVAQKYSIGFIAEPLLDVTLTDSGVSSNRSEFYKSRCYLLKKYKQYLIDYGKLDEALISIFQLAQRDGILPQIQKMVMLYLS